MENHDEPRAAATFPPGTHEAAAVITYLSPGLRFFHQGQFEGRRMRISPHLVRAPLEPVDEALQRFYHGLLAVLRQPAFRDGQCACSSACQPGIANRWSAVHPAARAGSSGQCVWLSLKVFSKWGTGAGEFIRAMQRESLPPMAKPHA